MQKKDLAAYSELILGIPDYEIFEDVGYSGKNTDRPAFQRMMDRVRAHEFSHVLVWKIDRISRNLLDFSEMYRELKALRVTFVSKNEQFDTSTAMGEAMLKIILVFAELERNMASERVAATMLSRASQGHWNGGRVPYGYDYDFQAHVFSIREDEASVCRMIRDDYLAFHSIRHVAEMLNGKGLHSRSGASWSSQTVSFILANPFYAGIYRYNYVKESISASTKNPEDQWIVLRDHHPAIFSLDEHERIVAIMQKNSEERHSPGKQCYRGTVHIFSRLCVCGRCGSPVTATKLKPFADGYVNSRYRCTHFFSGLCKNPAMNEIFLGEFVVNYILNILNARKEFPAFASVDDLEARLLRGSIFAEVTGIEPDGLNDLFLLLSRFPENAPRSPLLVPVKDPPPVNPERDALLREQERQERALKRLQDLYLYSEDAMPESEFIAKKTEITVALGDIRRQLDLLSASAPDASLSDEEFMEKASRLLINSWLSGKDYINFREFAGSVSHEVLHEYLAGVIDRVFFADHRVTRIVFKNGLDHRFLYE